MAVNTQTKKKQIVILGGSYSGLSTAHYLLKHALPFLADPYSFELVLVSTSSQAMCRPACPRAMISDDFFNQEKLFVDIPTQFNQYPSTTKFRFIHGHATALDHVARTVSVSLISPKTPETVNLVFHALIIATGASTPSPLLGLNTGDASLLRASWATFRTSLSSTTTKNIVIAGGGPTGVEVAGELGQHLNGRAPFYQSSFPNPKVNITLVTASSRILPRLREALSQQAEAYLAKVGVRIITDTRVVDATPPSNSSATNKDVLLIQGGETSSVTLLSKHKETQQLRADIYIPCVGTTPNTDFISSSSGLLSTSPESTGRVLTNPSTLRVDAAGPGAQIYAIGDVSNYAASPAIHNVLAAVPILCTNIKTDLLLSEAGTTQKEVGVKDRLFKEDVRETQLVPIGTSKGVGAMMGYRLPSFMVWLFKGRDYWLWTTGRLWSGKQWAKES
ncbi:hypothetical protein B0H66DRAFT_310310 [Apodospora peruviana]|uniref:FAD/NAD(P)-binding domain-containing protein n=1 Tax=Apodospora peruviana TaxID=516989 RepID=A0AAE0M352_9PEZI|nr:hypothetical protein B0H66DRAFT_310310 [Apodospora peruviana]